MKTIELTPEELQMIEIERKKKALAEEEAAAKEQLELAAKITAKKKAIQAQLHEEGGLAAETKAMFEKLHALDSGYTLVPTTKKELHTVTKYYGRDYDSAEHKGLGPNGEVETILWSQEEEHTTYHIEYKTAKISPEKKYSNDAWRPSYKGIEFAINFSETRRTYKNAKTIHSFVIEYFAAKNTKAKEAARIADDTEWLLAELATMCPTAISIEAKSEWRSYGSYKHGGYEKKFVVAKFASGMSVNFVVTQDGEGVRKASISEMVIGEKNQQAVIDLLK